MRTIFYKYVRFVVVVVVSISQLYEVNFCKIMFENIIMEKIANLQIKKK